MHIPARFNGPPGSGNGGWSAGAFAVAAGAGTGGAPFQVTLRVPPPLDTELTRSGGTVLAPDGTLVAEVEAGGDAGEPVPPVPVERARAAATAFPGFTAHPFPTCYVCGPERPDGLRLFPGGLPDGRTAAPWSVPADVTVETMWAALDCPGGWSALHDGRTYLLGRITAAVDAVPPPGASCVVVGRLDAMVGRKATTSSTVYSADGTPLATARGTWIAPAPLP
ncbi:hypothetical protein [Jidongwangia harbinensis]|uniref:hypothetical protein n=1 Tax=Jidongwangia harbinensis TaxID=2878561 RepID=UPI001CDA0CA1|nr:hypothetical protein [Jidongwangia harbinensis]MCA2213446.1 hypothetical protein [Jidongwangia harbinensis]